MRRWLLLLVGCWLLAASSCMCGPQDVSCNTSVDCPTGQLCVSGLCRGGSSTVGGGAGGTGGIGGTGGLGGTGGTGATGGVGGTGATGGAGGTGGVGGLGGFGGGGGTAGNGYDGGCGPIDAGNPPLPKRCTAPTQNECDGNTDSQLGSVGITGMLLNGGQGNGFDDDCDGLVDEGCLCSGNGTTKDCYLVPATQADRTSRLPVGWCAANAKGSLDCGGGEFSTWSGVCRGAQVPAPTDTCGPGDFDCDGLAGNNQTAGCACGAAVACPTTPLTLSPFPPTNAIPRIDGSLWIQNATQRAQATNWTWTILGGDCDNVLPNPTFAIYNADAGVPANQRGARTTVRFDAAAGKYVVQTGQPLAAVRAENYGNGVAGGQINAAFGLSGDYIVQGEFTLNGTVYTCTQKVQVRAPGIRAELCWDSVGPNDIDLHFARLQGITCPTQGWDGVCNQKQDCYYSSSSGCPNGGTPGWGFANSPNTACQGWSSRRTTACTNPRLDKDNVGCSRTNTDPTSGTFCGPENINLDNPNDNESYVVGVNHFGGAQAKPHVNVYCNGERVLSVGYNPATGQTSFPLLKKAGGDSTGDFWVAATVKTHVTGGQITSCDVASLPSRHPDPTRDGPNNTSVCVDSTANASTPAFSYTSHAFVDTGSTQGIAAGTQPAMPAQWCKH